MDEYDFKMISVKGDTHQRFRILAATNGLNNTDTLTLLLDTYERYNAQGEHKQPDYHGEGIA